MNVVILILLMCGTGAYLLRELSDWVRGLS